MGRNPLGEDRFKRCVTCGTRYPDFVFQARRSDCPDCRSEADICRKYGVDRYQYRRMVAAQGGRCAVCAVHPPKLLVDHDHKTGAVRGLLCDPCNKGLGNFRDSSHNLLKAIAYLYR